MDFRTNAAADQLLGEVMQAVAAKHGFALSRRSWGETTSLELIDGQRKVFSLQIASRDRWLDAPVEAAWAPVRIETLRDNAASKMTALVERGAPRDLRDIHQLCDRGLMSVDDCWTLYREKNPSGAERDAAAKVLYAVERLEMQRPLDKNRAIGTGLQAGRRSSTHSRCLIRPRTTHFVRGLAGPLCPGARAA